MLVTGILGRNWPSGNPSAKYGNPVGPTFKSASIRFLAVTKHRSRCKDHPSKSIGSEVMFKNTTSVLE